MSAKESIADFLETRKKYPDGVAMWHCRIATHGTKTVENCHPFQLGGDPLTYLGHNGIITIAQAKDDPRSDTAVFAEELLPAIGGVAVLDNPLIVAMLEKYIVGSKVVVITVNPKAKKNIYILNQSAGNVDTDGIWWSNTYHRNKRPTQNNYYCGGNGRWNNETQAYDRDFYLTHRWNSDLSRHEKIITMFTKEQWKPKQCVDEHKLSKFGKPGSVCVRCATLYSIDKKPLPDNGEWWIMTQGDNEKFFTYSLLESYDKTKTYNRPQRSHAIRKGCKVLGKGTVLAHCFEHDVGWDDRPIVNEVTVHTAVNGCSVLSEGTSIGYCSTHKVELGRNGGPRSGHTPKKERHLAIARP